jgi:hypothetical protein
MALRIFTLLPHVFWTWLQLDPRAPKAYTSAIARDDVTEMFAA